MITTDITPVQEYTHEIFSTPAGSVYQSDKENCFYLDFHNKKARFSIVCLFRLKKIIDKIDVESMMMDAKRSSDVEIVSLCACEHVYVLSVTEVIALKELLQGTKVMIELNSILRERLYRVAL
jgi:hypothetical protein